MKFAVSLFLAVVVGLLLSTLVPPAYAEPGDQRPCMTHQENRQVERGMTMGRSFAIIDSSGQPAPTGSSAQKQRVFDVCWSNDFGIAVFYKFKRHHWRVIGKAIA